jgi:hypothetical protein
MDVTAQASPQIVQIAELVEVIELRFESSKEAFHCSIIETVSPARHALSDCALLKRLTV